MRNLEAQRIVTRWSYARELGCMMNEVVQSDRVTRVIREKQSDGTIRIISDRCWC
jgi:hypothetical protein